MPNPSCIFAYGIDGNVPLSKMQLIQLFDSSILQCINVSSLHKLFSSALFRQVNTLLISFNFSSFYFVLFVSSRSFLFSSSIV